MSYDDELKARELIEQYADAPQSTETSVQEFKKMLRHFLENGPGTREERMQILMRNMVELHEEYKDFLNDRN
ncbi:hypothetical protein [Nitrobacter vulgaris]|uniref:Uncharacterized protein n=1 Tax=Nitrobacter vulgaris TaxID=29421 RepID=A0A1V4I1M4_NITVU|nr:hypothetical protein [Nitrobacter vulgaris]OPH84127.1 hypothetical protein B2M20_03045 [Nitrobacter vulgaris]